MGQKSVEMIRREKFAQLVRYPIHPPVLDLLFGFVLADK